MASHLDTGAQGEDAAVRYLRAEGYKIRERNVRFRRDEIDIVAFDPREKTVVFVEVKTRSRVHDAYPMRAAVDARKRRCLRRAIAAWLYEREYDGATRIDVVCVSQGRIVEHIRELGRVFP